MGATRGRESMSSCVQGLVKLAPLIMHLCCEVMNNVAFHEKGFQYGCLVSLEKCGDGKDINVSWDVVFVICIIYGSMRDMEVKNSKNMRS